MHAAILCSVAAETVQDGTAGRMCYTACLIAGQEYAKHGQAVRDACLLSPEAPRPLRRTASTLAAAGNAYAVAGRTTERPTASTGTSRPAARQQRESLRQFGDSPEGREQASEHRGGSCQPGAFPVPPPRLAGMRAGLPSSDTQRGPAEHPTGCAFGSEITPLTPSWDMHSHPLLHKAHRTCVASATSQAVSRFSMK